MLSSEIYCILYVLTGVKNLKEKVIPNSSEKMKRKIADVQGKVLNIAKEGILPRLMHVEQFVHVDETEVKFSTSEVSLLEK